MLHNVQRYSMVNCLLTQNYKNNISKCKTIRFVYGEEIVGLDNNEEVYLKVKTDDFVYRIMAGTYDASATPFVELIKAELMAAIFDSYNKLRR